MRRRLTGAVRLAALYFLTAAVSGLVTVRLMTRGGGVTVPALAGQDVQQVRRALATHGLEVAVEGEAWSETVPAGAVVAQQPPAGSRIKRGRRVTITLSRGSESVRVPHLTDQRLDEAEFLVRQIGLEPGDASFVPSPAPKRQVLAQSPAPGTTVSRGSRVVLLASDGPAPGAVAVPKVDGLPTREALAKMREAGLTITEVAYETTTVFEDGLVLAQAPPGGFRAAAGTEVRLRAARSGLGTVGARYVTFAFTVPAGPARRVVAWIVDETGRREIHNELEEAGRVLRFSTRVQGEAVAQFFVGGMLVEERKL